MTAHNGNYSPEEEAKRKYKREKERRRRIRKKIEEGRATAQEIAAIEAWERGEDWQIRTGERIRVEVQRPQDEPETEEESTQAGSGWGVLIGAGAVVAAFIGLMMWAGRNMGE